MEPHFALVAERDPVKSLWEAFPDLRNQLDEPGSGSYYIYSLFARHLLRHRDDDELWGRAYRFFDSLAVEGGEASNVLQIELLEPFSAHPYLATRLKANVGHDALRLLEGIQFGPDTIRPC